MRKIADKIKSLLSGLVRTLFVVLMIALGSMLTATLVLLAITVGIPLMAMVDAFRWHESVVDLLFEYEGCFIEGVSEGLHNVANQLRD